MRAAFYESDVTPPLGGYMWGHYREKRATEVHERLHAKAVVIEEGDGLAAIVVIDSCAIPEGMREAVTARITEYTGIPASCHRFQNIFFLLLLSDRTCIWSWSWCS